MPRYRRGRRTPRQPSRTAWRPAPRGTQDELTPPFRRPSPSRKAPPPPPQWSPPSPRWRGSTAERMPQTISATTAATRLPATAPRSTAPRAGGQEHDVESRRPLGSERPDVRRAGPRRTPRARRPTRQEPPVTATGHHQAHVVAGWIAERPIDLWSLVDVGEHRVPLAFGVHGLERPGRGSALGTFDGVDRRSGRSGPRRHRPTPCCPARVRQRGASPSTYRCRGGSRAWSRGGGRRRGTRLAVPRRTAAAARAWRCRRSTA